MNFDTDRIANLASLELNQEEKEAFQHSMDSILNFVETIAKLDLEENEAKIRSYDIPTHMRQDTIESSLSLEQLKKNTPKMDDSYLIVPQVIKK